MTLIRRSSPSVFTNLDYNDITEISIGVGDTLADPIILKSWTMTKDPSKLSQRTLIFNVAILSEMKRIAGGGNITVAIQYDDGFGGWTGITAINSSSAIYDSTEVISVLGNSTAEETTQFRIVAYNTNGTTSGSIKYVRAYTDIILSPTYTMVED